MIFKACCKSILITYYILLLSRICLVESVTCNEFDKDPEKHFLSALSQHKTALSEDMSPNKSFQQALTAGLDCITPTDQIGGIVTTKKRRRTLKVKKTESILLFTADKSYEMKVVEENTSAKILQRFQKRLTKLDLKMLEKNNQWFVSIGNKSLQKQCDHIVGMIKKGSKCDEYDGVKEIVAGDLSSIAKGAYDDIKVTVWVKEAQKQFVLLICVGPLCNHTPDLTSAEISHIMGGDSENLLKRILMKDVVWHTKSSKKGPIDESFKISLNIDAVTKTLDIKKEKGSKKFKFIPYAPAKVSYAEITSSMAAMSGVFSGCPFVKYKHGGKSYAAHIGTCDDDKTSKNGYGESKQAWNAFYDSSGGLTDVFCVNPVHGIDEKTAKGNVVYAFADSSDKASFTILTLDESDPTVFGFYKKDGVAFTKFNEKNGSGCQM
jgi:hypothetical protein